MITDNEIYAISGKDLKQFVHLVSDLKDVAMDYTKRVNELDIKETELFATLGFNPLPFQFKPIFTLSLSNSEAQNDSYTTGDDTTETIAAISLAF
mgnify:CR=1 FL=1